MDRRYILSRHEELRGLRVQEEPAWRDIAEMLSPEDNQFTGPKTKADYGAIYRGTGHGFVAFVHGAHEQLLAHTHQLGSVSIVVCGERAVSEAYVTMQARRRAEDGSLLELRSTGRYLDRWERRDGRWAISARHYVQELDDCWPTCRPGLETTGRRDRSDPSYALFASLGDPA